MNGGQRQARYVGGAGGGAGRRKPRAMEFLSMTSPGASSPDRPAEGLEPTYSEWVHDRAGSKLPGEGTLKVQNQRALSRGEKGNAAQGGLNHQS